MNLKSLARTQGVPTTTVRHPQNGYPEVKALMRERVLAAKCEAGDQADLVAHSPGVGRPTASATFKPLLPSACKP